MFDVNFFGVFVLCVGYNDNGYCFWLFMIFKGVIFNFYSSFGRRVFLLFSFDRREIEVGGR